jgi:hypothetical protein
MTRFLFTQEPLLIVLLSYSRWGDGKSTAIPIIISAAESAPAGIAALVPGGSAPELSHKRTELGSSPTWGAVILNIRRGHLQRWPQVFLRDVMSWASTCVTLQFDFFSS